MSRYIDADEFLTNESEAYMNAQIKLAKENADKTIDADRYINLLVHKKIQMLIADTPHINLDDYVPKDFHDKTCEAMAKAHQEEIADMVSVVRCKECKWHDTCCRNIIDNFDEPFTTNIEYCSHGERKEDER